MQGPHVEGETGESSLGVSALSGHSNANWQHSSKLVVQGQIESREMFYLAYTGLHLKKKVLAFKNE